jgi:hypothetical protein
MRTEVAQRPPQHSHDGEGDCNNCGHPGFVHFAGPHGLCVATDGSTGNSQDHRCRCPGWSPGVLGGPDAIDAAVMARLRAPFACEFIPAGMGELGRWRIHDANDDAIASCAAAEEGYARLIVQALNEHFERKGRP